MAPFSSCLSLLLLLKHGDADGGLWQWHSTLAHGRKCAHFLRRGEVLTNSWFSIQCVCVQWCICYQCLICKRTSAGAQSSSHNSAAIAAERTGCRIPWLLILDSRLCLFHPLPYSPWPFISLLQVLFPFALCHRFPHFLFPLLSLFCDFHSPLLNQWLMMNN